jgi:glycerate dehydrogenase
LAPHRIVYLQRATLDAGVTVRRPAFEHEWVEYPATPVEEIAGRLAGATIAVSNKFRLTRETIASAPTLKLIAIAATGHDSVDLDACRDLGIAVTNVRRYSEHSVAEHTLMLMLAVSRHLKGYATRTALGAWNQSQRFYLEGPAIGDLYGKTLTIVGRGGLGTSVARLAEAFGMKVLWAERKGAAATRAGYTPFMDALAAADFVSLHCPFSPENLHMIGEPELRAMKKTAYLVNTARGKLIDEPTLVWALMEGWIAGAALDVLSAEPPAEGNVLLDQRIANLLITPHIAWGSTEARQALADELIDCMEAFVRGERLNRLD